MKPHAWRAGADHERLIRCVNQTVTSMDCLFDIWIQIQYPLDTGLGCTSPDFKRSSPRKVPWPRGFFLTLMVWNWWRKKKKEKKDLPLNCSGSSLCELHCTCRLPPATPNTPSHPSLYWLEPNVFHHEPLKPVIVKVTRTASDKRVVPRWLSHLHLAVITLLMELQQPRALHKK